MLAGQSGLNELAHVAFSVWSRQLCEEGGVDGNVEKSMGKDGRETAIFYRQSEAITA